MLLKRLEINNFKGISSLSINFYNRTNIYGDNGVGKTTVYDAWLWLLFGKDSQNRTDFEIKPIRNGQVIHNVETSVEAVVEIDGKEYTFKKVFKEKWVKKRGQAQQEFTGHTTDHYINGVPCKKTEYTDAINNIAKEDIFKVLSSVTYFNEQIDWKRRRQILFEIANINNSSDADIAKMLGDDFLDLVPIFKHYTADDYKKMIKSRLKKINKELESIPVRIDELRKRIQDVVDVDIAHLSQELENLKKQRADLIMQPVENPIDKKILELRKKIEVEDTRRRELVAKLQPSKSSEAIQTEIKILEDDIKAIEKQIEQKRQEWFTENDKQPEIDNVCPCCGQPIPPEHIEKAISEFNKRKSEKLSQISDEGKRLVTLKENKEKLLDKLYQELESVKKAEEKINNILNADIPELNQIKELETQKQQQKDLNTEKQEQIKLLTAQIEQLEERVARAKTAKEIKQRIAELEEQEKELVAAFAEIEEELNLIDGFITEKVRLIEKTVAKEFSIAQFKLFDTQINGGVTETCETMVNGIPYRNLNNGTKINVGLDIIKTLQKHYKISIPVFIDNAESVNELIDMGETQVVRLIVSKDKKLKIEEAK